MKTEVLERIGDGSDENPFRPDVDLDIYRGYRVIEEYEDSFLVELFERTSES